MLLDHCQPLANSVVALDCAKDWSFMSKQGIFFFHLMFCF
uniref:Uncharacterized protein n=1 Tax=Anguilla anguilla TaxID=7936 RepID=A0A0E9UVT9_ANGAN